MGGFAIWEKNKRKEKKKNRMSGQGGDMCHLPKQDKRDDL